MNYENMVLIQNSESKKPTILKILLSKIGLINL